MANAKRFVLEVSQSNEVLLSPHFVVEITPEYASLLVKRIRALKAMTLEDSRAYKTYYWDWSGDYFDVDPELHVEETPDALATDANQLVVMEDKVFWFAYPKHCDAQLQTDYVSLWDLMDVAAGRTDKTS